MPQTESSQAAVLSPRVEAFFHVARSAVAEYLTEFGRRVDASLRGLRGELESAREEIARHERHYADRFNVFAYIDPDENRLSDILAGLLDPKGAHGQGDIFLRLFAGRLGVALPAETRAVKVFREEATAYITNPLRRIDVVADFGTFGLAVENKPWAGEQARQVQDYLDHLRGRYGDAFVLVYLSGAGAPPESVDPAELARLEARGRFRLLDYRNGLSAWLGDCISACEAESVRWFLRHFQRYATDTFGWADRDERAGQ